MRKILLILVITMAISGMIYAAGEGEGATGDVPVVTMFGGLHPAIESLDSPDNEFTLFMEDKFGVKIEWVTVPSDQRREKQNLIMAAGDYPAVFWMGDFTNEDQMRYGSQGVLQALNSLIDSNGPGVQAAFALKPYFKKEITTPDGNIYSLPAFEECYHCSVNQKLWINKPWLDTLGLDYPSTTAEYESTLLAFKNRDPNGNGKADEIPHSGATGTWMADPWYYLMTPFVYNDADRFVYINNNNQIDFAADTPEWREGIRYMARLFEQGLMDAQGFTQNMDAMRATMNGEEVVVGAYTAGHNRMFPRNEGLWQQYFANPPLEGPKGIRQAAYFPSGTRNGKFAITNKASDIVAQKAMEMASYAYTKEGTVMQIWGLPKDGENWRWANADEKGLNGRPAIYYGSPHAWDRTARLDAWNMEVMFWHFDLFNGWAGNQDTTVIEGYERFLVVESDKYIDLVPDKIVQQRVYMAPEVAQEYGQTKTDITDYVKQKTVLMITGQMDVETEWNDYVAGFEKFGVDKYVQMIDDAINS